MIHGSIPYAREACSLADSDARRETGDHVVINLRSTPPCRSIEESTRQSFAACGAIFLGLGCHTALAQYRRAEFERWRKLIAELKLKVD